MIDPVANRDFFISYTTADRAWAEWIAWELENAGYTTLIQAWDFRPGMDFVTQMQKGATEFSRTLIVLSQQYLESGFSQAEWTAAFAQDPTGEKGILVPIRVAECEPPGLLRARIYVDFVGLSEEDAIRSKLLEGVRQDRVKPATRPSLPVLAKPRPVFPPAMPTTIHNLPFPPNPTFTGRDAELKKLQEYLQEDGELVTTKTIVVHGLGGVGKTQLAVEYAWEHLGEYSAILWVKADSPVGMDANLSMLSSLLGLPEANKSDQIILMKAVLGWLHDNDRWLLIVDNTDTEQSAKAVRDTISPNLRGTVLVTSRLSSWPVTMPNFSLDFLLPQDAANFLLDRVAKEGHNAGDETAARSLANELGHLPLALEQAAAFIIEVRWTFDKYCEHLREARPALLSHQWEGGTHYPTSIAKTWSISLNQLSALARTLLRIGAWYAPDAIPRDMFVSSHGVFSELLSQSGSLSNITIEKALGELNRLSLICLTSKTASIHRLLQAVEKDSLTAEDCKLWIERAVQLFNALTPEPAEDVRTRDIWTSVSQHAETLIEHAQRHDVSSMSIAILAHEFGQFMLSRSAYAQAEPLTRLALVITEKHLTPNNIIIAIRLNNLAMVLNGTNRPREAALLLRRAIAISEQSADSTNQNHLLSQLSNLAGVLQSSNQTDDAEKLYRRALKIAEEQLGPDDPKLATTLDNFATMLQQTRRFKEAEPLCRKALAIEEKRPDPDHPNLAGRLGNLGMLLQATNRLQEAEPLYRRALQVYERCLLPDDPRIAVSLNNLAGLLYDTQRLLEAEPLLRRALQIDRKSLSSDNCALATHLFNLARLLQDTDRLEEAEPLMQEALSILVHFGASTGHLPPELRSVIHTYAALLKPMGNGDAEINVKIREVCRPLGFDIFLWAMLDIKRPL